MRAATKPASGILGGLLLLLGCSFATDQGYVGDEVSFALSGRRYVLNDRTEYVGASIVGTSLSVSADDYVTHKPSISFSVTRYHGAGLYQLGPDSQDGQAGVRVDDVSYDTARHPAQGSLRVESAGCRTRTVTDPITGITGPVTFCHLRGTFSFIAVNEAGATATVTDGGFELSAQQRSNY